jgi:hypothetical protein
MFFLMLEGGKEARIVDVEYSASPMLSSRCGHGRAGVASCWPGLKPLEFACPVILKRQTEVESGDTNKGNGGKELKLDGHRDILIAVFDVTRFVFVSYQSRFTAGILCSDAVETSPAPRFHCLKSRARAFDL